MRLLSASSLRHSIHLHGVCVHSLVFLVWMMAFNSCPPTRNIIGGMMFTFQCQAAIFPLRCCTAVDKGIYYIAARALLAPSANVHDDDTSLQLPAAACFVYTGPSVIFTFANLRLSTFRFFRSIQCNISIDKGHCETISPSSCICNHLRRLPRSCIGQDCSRPSH